MKTEQTKQTKPLLLWWFDKNTNKNLPAGVALILREIEFTGQGSEELLSF